MGGVHLGEVLLALVRVRAADISFEIGLVAVVKFVYTA